MSERTNGWMTEWVKHWVTDGLCIACLVCTWNCKIYLLFYLHKFPGGNCKHILMHSAMAQRQWRGDEGVKGGDSMTSTSVPSTHTHIQSLTEPLMVHLRLHRLHDITATRAKASAYTLYYCHVWQRNRSLYKAAIWAHCMQPTHSFSLLPLSLSPRYCILNALRDIKFGAGKYATFFTFLNSIKIHISGRL